MQQYKIQIRFFFVLIKQKLGLSNLSKKYIHQITHIHTNEYIFRYAVSDKMNKKNIYI